MDLNLLKLSAVFVKGTDQEIDINFNIDQTTVGTYQAEGFSTQSFSLTQTATGELLFTRIVQGVTVTYTEITHTGDNWTEITQQATLGQM